MTGGGGLVAAAPEKTAITICLSGTDVKQKHGKYAI